MFDAPSAILFGIIEWVRAHLLLLQFISLVISGIFLAIIVYLNTTLNLTGEKIQHWMDVIGAANISKRHSLKIWKQIQKRLQSGDATQLKLAVLEADRVLDEVLKLAGYSGSTLSERLEGMNESQLSNLKEVREAHRIRNRIVAEPGFTLVKNEAELAVGIYARAFEELGLLE